MESKAGNSLVVNLGDDLTIANRNSLPYKHLESLGVGGSAFVEKVQNTTTGEIFAHKVFRRYHGPNLTKFKEEVQNEIQIVRRLSSHPHIIQVFATYTCGRELGMILTPVADRGDLASYLQDIADSGRPLTYEQRAILNRAFGCLASGLAFIHEQTIRHKDIKPQNILIHQGRVIYADFGIAFDASQHDSTTTVGTSQAFTFRYCAPEVANSAKRNRKSDIFSLGCVFIEILEAVCPLIKAEPLGRVPYHKIIDDLRSMLINAMAHVMGAVWKGLIRVCLEVFVSEPEERISAEGLVRELSSLGNHNSHFLRIIFCDNCREKRLPHLIKRTDGTQPCSNSKIQENPDQLQGRFSYTIELRIVNKTNDTFDVVEERGTWAELEGGYLLLMEVSGTSGMLRFKSFAGETFCLVVGFHNYKRWCDIVVDLNDDDTAQKIYSTYYDIFHSRYSVPWKQISEITRTTKGGTTLKINFSEKDGRKLVADFTIEGTPKQLKILSIDGGGIRGLSSLLILERIMHRLRKELKKPNIEPYQHFDLIGGTSTGGIIALMLGRLRMGVKECINEYCSLSISVFSNVIHKQVASTSMWPPHQNHQKPKKSFFNILTTA